MGNTITAVFKEGSLSTRATGLWQWDYGQILEIVGLPLPRSVELHIVQKSNMISRIGLTEDSVTRVAIPDDYLETSDPITIYVYLHTGEDDGETEYRIILPIIPRPKPVDYDTEDHEVSVAYQALVDATALMSSDIETVRAMKNTTEQYMNTAGTKAEEAGQAATESVDAATEARSWAVGGTGSRDGEDTNNSKWWSEKAAESAEEVKAYLARETTTQIGRVTEEGNKQVQRVSSAGSEAINTIETAGNEQITAIDAAGDGQIEDIEAVGMAQVNAVKAEGVRQAQDISDSKDAVVEAVSAEGTRQIEIIASKETETTNRITAAGNTQVGRVNQMGTTQYYAIGSLSSQEKLEIQKLGNQTKNAVTAIANTAKSYAVGDTGTRTGEDTDNAKFYAERAAECVLPGGYIITTIGEDGHLYVTVAEPLKENVSIRINEETGHLEVTVA